MSVIKKPFTCLSSDGEHTLMGVVYEPTTQILGYLHIVHGMTEHIARYDRFMRDMAEAGYICFGYDALGHGNTARDDSELGFIAKKNGWELLVSDVKVFSDKVRQTYGDLPYYLLGHSMGSFVVRTAASKVAPEKLVIMGTAGKNPAADAGLFLIALIKLIFGEKHISPLIDKIAFGSYNKRFGGGAPDDPKPWLTCDRSVRERYYADKFCSFNFTVSAMGDLIRLIKEANSNAFYKDFPNKTQVLLVSGEEDPVGNYGEGVLEVSRKLSDAKVETRCILYSGARHEILNDITYDTVKNDILKFLQ